MTPDQQVAYYKALAILSKAESDEEKSIQKIAEEIAIVVVRPSE